MRNHRALDCSAVGRYHRHVPPYSHHLLKYNTKWARNSLASGPRIHCNSPGMKNGAIQVQHWPHEMWLALTNGHLVKCILPSRF